LRRVWIASPPTAGSAPLRSRPLGRAWTWARAHLLWLALLSCLVGCGAPTHAVDRWQLRLDAQANPIPVHLPTHLNHLVPDRDLAYELVTSYSLPGDLRGRDADFVMPHFWGQTELWVDGARAVSAQQAPLHGHRASFAHVYRIPARATLDGTLQLRLLVHHRWTHSAWFDVVPRIVSSGEQDRSAELVRLFNENISLVASAWLIQIGISALAIYLSGGRRREYLWLGFQALFAASYPIFIHGDLLRIFGRYEVPVVAAALVGAVWVALRFTYDFFELGKFPWAWDAFCALGVLVCLLGFDPYWCTIVSGSATILVVTVGVIAQVRLGFKLLPEPRWHHDARWFLGCWLALALTTWSDMAMWAGFGEVFGGAHVACAGLAVFSFFLSLMLSQRHLSSLSRSDRLASELEVRVRQLETRSHEVEELNTELRRQIAERSEQIYAALSLRDRTASPATALQPGDVVQGRYRVVELRGSGGMGAVYEVCRIPDGKPFALKLARDTHGHSLALLAREAQIAAQLSHPNIVKIVDVDVASSGFLYLVMELVDGKPLHQLQNRFGDPLWTLSVLQQVASGLAVLHRAGIVHRDVKPPNILVRDSVDPRQVEAKITDFGIARFTPRDLGELTPNPVKPEPVELVAHGASELDTVSLSARSNTGSRPSLPPRSTGDTGLFTRSGQVAGTPLYMAPELARRGTKATAAADIYSLGVLAWELIARRRPSLRPAAAAVLAGEVPEPPPSMAPLARSVPQAVSRAIDRCLALEPQARPSAEELEQVLLDALSELST
jgi:serine/threonine protein kinase